MRSADGDEYIGKYKDNKRHGEGTWLSNYTGEEKYGVWADGVLVSWKEKPDDERTKSLSVSESIQPTVNIEITNLEKLKAQINEFDITPTPSTSS